MGRDVWASIGTALLLVTAVAAPFLLLSGALAIELAYPLGLALGAAVLPILLLHVLKARRPRSTVASLMLWRSVVLDQQANSPFKRLRRRLTLLLQLLALACLTYGLMGPTIQAAVDDGARRVAIVIDVSASMATEDVGGLSRFAAAVDGARELVAGLGPDDKAMLVAAGRRPRIVIPWTADRSSLRRGLSGLTVRHVEGRLDQALVLVASTAAEVPLDAVHVFSDGGGPGLGDLELGEVLRYHPLGDATSNVGITAAELRPRTGSAELSGAADGLAYQVFVNVLNAGSADQDLFVTLQRGPQLLAARKLSLPKGDARPLVLEARLTPGPVIVRLLPTLHGSDRLDALEVDDHAALLVPDEVGAPVRLVASSETPALRRALEAAGARLTEADDAPLVVCDQTSPPAGATGDLLIFGPVGPVGPVGLGEPVVAPRVAGWDRADPLLEWVDLQDVEVERSRGLELGPGARALLQGEDPESGDPVVLIAAYAERGRRRVVVGFDAYRSTWPLRASFPIFVRNAVALASADDVFAAGASVAGYPVLLPAPTDADAVVVVDPDGRRLSTPARGGRAPFAETATVGVYTLETPTGDRPFCVNLLAPAETRVAARRELQLGAAQVGPAPDAAAERPVPIAWVFALAATLALVVEAWAYHRRW